MTIIEWFDPRNDMHIWAYDYLRKTGTWPDYGIKIPSERPVGWQIALMAKLADAYVDEKIGG